MPPGMVRLLPSGGLHVASFSALQSLPLCPHFWHLSRYGEARHPGPLSAEHVNQLRDLREKLPLRRKKSTQRNRTQRNF
eukprot:1168101-Amphidinium_carterae.1